MITIYKVTWKLSGFGACESAWTTSLDTANKTVQSLKDAATLLMATFEIKPTVASTQVIS